MTSIRSFLLLAITLLLSFNIVAAEYDVLRLRDAPSSSTNTQSQTSLASSASPSGSSSTSGGSASTASTTGSVSSSTTTSELSSTPTPNATSSMPVSASSTGLVANSTLPAIFNTTWTPDELPLTPRITPAFGVAGVFLILTGAVYALIGIRIRLVHVYLSAAYLSSLSVTVLIIYVMTPPVSDALQGAYFVAIVMTGLIVGAGAIIFKEITEGLGCLFGGFCLSMWLLVLQPGGLLTGTGHVAGFISAFSVVGFAMSFSHTTRNYGLIASQAFGGGTVVVLGIDCYSRAGLKEFWVYIWNLNDNLFPLGVTSYPLTRGMKVEIAAIVIVCLAGLVSQSRLWAFIKERRERRAAQRLEDEEDLEREAAGIGRRIESLNARERDQWERVYGDKDAHIRSSDSGVGGFDTPKEAQSIVTTPQSPKEEIEMTRISDSSKRNSSGTSIDMKQTPVTINVIPDGEKDLEPVEEEKPEFENIELAETKEAGSIDETPETSASPQLNTDAQSLQPEEQKRHSQLSSKRSSALLRAFALPFKIPDAEDDDTQSTVATVADDEKRLSKRLSVGSGLFRSISKRSHDSKRLSAVSNMSASNEHLVARNPGDRSSYLSMAATIDDLSDHEDLESLARVSTDGQEKPQEETTDPTISASQPAIFIDDEVADDGEKEATKEALPVDSQSEISTIKEPRKDIPSIILPPTANLSKERLPAPESRVVKTYRTNEWAKHLSTAEMPESNESSEPADVDDEEIEEKAAPVDIIDLQQSGQTVQERPASQMVQLSSPPPSRPGTSVDRPGSRSQLAYPRSRQSSRPVSQQSGHSVSTIQTMRNSSAPALASFSPDSPTVGRPSSRQMPYASTSTLISQRDSMVRKKTSTPAFSPLQSTPEDPAVWASTSAGSGRDSRLQDLSDNVSLSARQSLIRQSSLPTMPPAAALSNMNSVTRQQPTFDSHQPRRQSTAMPTNVRESQLASWRASMQQDLRGNIGPTDTINRQRDALWAGRQAEQDKRMEAEARKKARDSAFDQRMRRGDMLDAHREAMRKMQGLANKNL